MEERVNASNTKPQVSATEEEFSLNAQEKIEVELRERNIIAYIVDDEKEEIDEEELVEKVQVILNVLRVDAEIDKVYRLGKFSGLKARPVCFSVTRARDAHKILEKKNKLKNTEFANIYLNKDLPASVRLKIYHLRTQRKTASQFVLQEQNRHS